MTRFISGNQHGTCPICIINIIWLFKCIISGLCHWLSFYHRNRVRRSGKSEEHRLNEEVKQDSCIPGSALLHGQRQVRRQVFIIKLHWLLRGKEEMFTSYQVPLPWLTNKVKRSCCELFLENEALAKHLHSTLALWLENKTVFLLTCNVPPKTEWIEF